jgi:hypothetical protein
VCQCWYVDARPSAVHPPHTHTPPAQLQALLKLTKEKWEEAMTHALTAVESDFRKRAWCEAEAGAWI